MTLQHATSEFTTDNFFYHKESKSFSQEVSSLNNECYDTIKLTNPKTNGSQIYKLVKTIWSGSGEDREVGGWEYQSTTRPELKLTIWND
jgi:hypothetical protein